MSLAAGQLDRRIKILKRQVGQDEAGQPVDTWVQWKKPWARIKGQTGMGAIASAPDGVALAIKSYSMRIRYLPAVTEDMRVEYGGQVFELVKASHDFAGRQWTDLVCQVGGSNG